MKAGDSIKWLNNPWLIGIVGGIISGLIVYLATNFFIARREKKEYWRSLENAKSELCQFIRSLAVEKTLPDPHIIEAVVRSTAKKHGVEDHLADCVEDVFDDIIKEIGENPFLDAQQKLELCGYIHSKRIEVRKRQTLAKDISMRQLRWIRRSIPLSLGLGTIIFAFFGTYLITNEYPTMATGSDDLMILLVTLTLLMTVTAFITLAPKNFVKTVFRAIHETIQFVLPRERSKDGEKNIEK